jgi:hypothetical protein
MHYDQKENKYKKTNTSSCSSYQTTNILSDVLTVISYLSFEVISSLNSCYHQYDGIGGQFLWVESISLVIYPVETQWSHSEMQVWTKNIHWLT